MPATSFPRHLSDSDALMWRIEADPVLRSPIVVVARLDCEPSWAGVIGTFQRAVDVVPRLGQRVAAGPFGLGPLRWVDDPSFDVRHHIRRVRAAHGDGMRGALDLAEADAVAAFDPARPPWQATLIEGIGAGRAALVWRFHHAITDGVGGVELASAIFEHDREAPVTDGAEPPAPAPAAGSGTGGALPRRSLGWLGSPVAAVRMANRAVTDPVGTGRLAARTARSVARMLAPAPAPLSPLLEGRSIDRRLLVLEVPFAGLDHAAAAAGGTINDVFLAAVAGGMQRYHEAMHTPVKALRVTMPINLRGPSDPPGGNRFAPARFVLPVDDPDPIARAIVAGDIVRRWRAEPSLRLTSSLAAVLNRLPGPVLTRLFASMLRSIDVDAVDVPGLREDAYLAGARVDRLWAFAPPTGAALSITLVSHGETACIGLECDLAAVSKPEVLGACFEGALDELLSVAGERELTGVPS